ACPDDFFVTEPGLGVAPIAASVVIIIARMKIINIIIRFIRILQPKVISMAIRRSPGKFTWSCALSLAELFLSRVPWSEFFDRGERRGSGEEMLRNGGPGAQRLGH